MLKKIGKNAVSYLVLRELLLRDYCETNKLCTNVRCGKFRRDCECERPSLLAFHGARTGVKRRKLEQDCYENGRRPAKTPCQFGCSFVATGFSSLLEHERRCRKLLLQNTTLREKVSTQINSARGNILLERALGEEGSDCNELN